LARAGKGCETAKAEPVTLQAPNGARLAGLRMGQGPRGVVLGHQAGGDVCDLFAYGAELAAKGYLVLAVDFESNGASDPVPPAVPGTSGTPVRPYADDLIAAVAHLRAAGATRVAVVGPSMGGTAAVVAGSRATPPVQAVVSLSGPATFGGMDAVAAAASGVPQLVVGSRSDPDVRKAELEAVHAAARGEGQSQILLLDGRLHGKQLLGNESVRSAVGALLEARLAENP